MRPRFADLVGVPYVEGGRDRERDGGLDCYGLVRAGLMRLGLQWPENEAIALATPECLAEPVSGRVPRTGDVVEMVIGDLRHIGLMLDETAVLHAQRGSRSVISTLSGLRRLRIVVGIARPWGLELAHGLERETR